MGNTNGNLHAAKKAKNDEFYTRLEDIENELRHYKQHFFMKEITVIKDPKLSTQYNPRFVIVEKETGKVLDNAQGYGYKTVQKAYAAWNYKNRFCQQNAQRFWP